MTLSCLKRIVYHPGPFYILFGDFDTMFRSVVRIDLNVATTPSVYDDWLGGILFPVPIRSPRGGAAFSLQRYYFLGKMVEGLYIGLDEIFRYILIAG